MDQSFQDESQSEFNFKLITFPITISILFIIINQYRSSMNNVPRLRGIVIVKLIKRIISVDVVHSALELLKNCFYIIFFGLFKLKSFVYNIVYLISNSTKISKDAINAVRSLFIAFSIIGKFILKLFSYIDKFNKR